MLRWFDVKFKLKFIPTYMEMDTLTFKQGDAWILGWDIWVDENIT
jgi:hypothetical protein